MEWYGVYDGATGRLLSIGSELGATLPPGVEVCVCAERPDARHWDVQARTFVEPKNTGVTEEPFPSEQIEISEGLAPEPWEEPETKEYPNWEQIRHREE